jgi:hypothetical protein
MTQPEDKDFIRRVREALKEHPNLRQALKAIGEDYYVAYTRLERMGYDVDRSARLVRRRKQRVAA